MNFGTFIIGEWKKFKEWCEKESIAQRLEVAELRARVTTLENEVSELKNKL